MARYPRGINVDDARALLSQMNDVVAAGSGASQRWPWWRRFGLGRDAAAAAHRVAAVDPDPQVARALDVALSPWDVTLVEVHLESPGASMPIALDRARSIAQDSRADVVVWVSSTDDGFAVWIYDAASDHASARKIDQAPPFDGPTAAGVALSVKTLLRGTVVAPPPERFGASTPGATLARRS